MPRGTFFGELCGEKRGTAEGGTTTVARGLLHFKVHWPWCRSSEAQVSNMGNTSRQGFGWNKTRYSCLTTIYGEDNETGIEEDGRAANATISSVVRACNTPISKRY